MSTFQDNVCSIRHVAFRGVNCSDAAGKQIDYRIIYPLLVNHSSGGLHWDEKAQSPFFNYKVSLFFFFFFFFFFYYNYFATGFLLKPFPTQLPFSSTGAVYYHVLILRKYAPICPKPL